MRNISIMVLIALNFAGISLSAQKISYGLQTGLDLVSNTYYNKNHGFFTGDEVIDFDPMLSYNFNVFFKYNLSQRSGIIVEPGYIRKGGIEYYNWENRNQSNGNKKLNWKFHYLQIPVLFDYNVNGRLYFSFGPELSYLLDITVRENGKNHKTELRDIFDSFDLSLIGGINTAIHKNIDLGIRYNHSILPYGRIYLINDDRYEDYFYSIYNRYLQMIIRYYIR